jgi:hypothetical protein
MAGYAGGPNDANGGSLDSLFAQLRQQSGSSPAPPPPGPNSQFYQQNPYYPQQQQMHAHPPHGYQHPSISSPLPTPPVFNQQPHHASAVMSPNSDVSQQRPAANAERSNHLLSLLKFSQPSASPPATLPQIAPRESRPSFGAVSNATNHSRAASGNGNDLLAALMGSSNSRASHQSSPRPNPPAEAPAPASQSNTFRPENEAPPSDTQAYLLQLLHRPKPAQTDAAPVLQPAVVSPPAATKDTDVKDLADALKETSIGSKKPVVFGASENAQQQSTQKNNSGLFTYVNPFEQLAASSPRNRTPKSGTPGPSAPTPAVQILKRSEGGEHKRKVVDERTPTASPAHSKRKLEEGTISSPPPILPDGRSRIDAIMGIGAPSHKETVADALNEISDKVDKQVEEAILKAEAEESQGVIEQDLRDLLSARTEKEFEENAQATASDIKKELEKSGNEHVLEESMPASVAEVVKDIIDDAAQGHIADDWEHAATEELPVKQETGRVVKVYNFPMKPFVSLTLKTLPDEERPTFRDESIMDIARLKKDFDQIDRTLVTATNSFIVYCMSKNGGIRIIRQDDGKDLKIFTETLDRVFSVAASTSEADLVETILGTGISGTVYWATVKDGEADFLSDEIPERHGFALPPLQTHDEGSPGGMLKTRARKSSSHPDFFAVGRGKSIHIIWPSVIMRHGYIKDEVSRVVDTEKYLSQRSLKINTGKAGKDFTFSQDDTTIVSLDKAGRVKFWDVRTLTNTSRDENRYPTPEQIKPVEIKDPLMTLMTTPANEKSWPTSVLFVDKLRPYQKGGALRYLIIGMKQNHSLQLWDLALGKPVQELHLPHEKESDAVCSVLYHAASGIIVVGHPTRNSIYFIHLSSPKYNLSKSMSQAEYTQKLVNNDPSLPKPDSTAVMSGIREYSFAAKGQLRSLDMLQNPSASSASGDNSVLFELYAMHSKGVTCMAIKPDDMGWLPDNRCAHPVEAVKAGLITVDSLKALAPAPINDAASDSGSPAPNRQAPRSPEKPMAREVGKKTILTDRTKPAESSAVPRLAEKTAGPSASVTTGQDPVASSTEKVSKNKKKKHAATSAAAAQIQILQAPKEAAAEPRTASPTKAPKSVAPELSRVNSNGQAESSTGPAQTGLDQVSIDGAMKAMEATMATALSRVISGNLEQLYKRIDDDKRTQAAVADAKQDAMLRLVSSTLSDNVQKTLAQIVNESIEKSVVPAISTAAAKAVNEQLSSKLNAQLKQTLPRELQHALPDAITKAILKPDVLRSISDGVVKAVAFNVEEKFADILNKSIAPAFTALAAQTAQKVGADVQRQANEQIASIERARQVDGHKIQQLTQLVSSLSEMVSSMADAQSKFQGEFLKVQQQASRDRQTNTSISRPSDVGSSGTRSVALTATPEDHQLEMIIKEISVRMAEGDFENAMVRWLQSQREQEIFQSYLSRLDTSFINELSPLMLVSVAATVTSNFDDNVLLERLAWVETIFNAIQPQLHTMEESVRSVTPKIMSILRSRVEQLFMRVSSVSAQDPLLKRLSAIANAAQRMGEAVETTTGPW